MSGIVPIEYNLHLDTGEQIMICELDQETTPTLSDPIVIEFLKNLLDRCSFVTREALEEAKLGRAKPLQNQIRSTPIGALLTITKPDCDHIKDCVMADKKKCSTRNIGKSGGKFPQCWDYQLDSKIPPEPKAAVAAIGAVIVHAWREGRHVFIVKKLIS
jgi:hypothetical protein